MIINMSSSLSTYLVFSLSVTLVAICISDPISSKNDFNDDKIKSLHGKYSFNPNDGIPKLDGKNPFVTSDDEIIDLHGKHPFPGRTTKKPLTTTTPDDRIFFPDDDEDDEWQAWTTKKTVKPISKLPVSTTRTTKPPLVRPDGDRVGKSHLENQLKLANYFTKGELERSSYTISPYLIDTAMKILGKTSNKCPLAISGLTNENFVNLDSDVNNEIYMWMNVIYKSGIRVNEQFKNSVNKFLGKNLKGFELEYKFLNFGNQGEISAYVRKTNSKAQEKVKDFAILDEKMFESDSDLIILLTLFFKAKWETPFHRVDLDSKNKEYLVFEDESEDEEDIPVTMRINIAEFEAAKGSVVNLYSFPYVGGKYSMVYVKSNISEESLLTKYRTQVITALNNTKPQDYYEVWVARINQELSIELADKPEFECFKESGNLNVLSSNTALNLNKIQHTVKFETTPEGTVGSAQVQQEIVSKSFSAKLTIKPPFEYFVYDHVNQFVLFEGALLD